VRAGIRPSWWAVWPRAAISAERAGKARAAWSGARGSATPSAQGGAIVVFPAAYVAAILTHPYPIARKCDSYIEDPTQFVDLEVLMRNSAHDPVDQLNRARVRADAVSDRLLAGLQRFLEEAAEWAKQLGDRILEYLAQILPPLLRATQSYLRLAAIVLLVPLLSFGLAWWMSPVWAIFGLLWLGLIALIAGGSSRSDQSDRPAVARQSHEWHTPTP
jgi:hypothetical protein